MPSRLAQWETEFGAIDDGCNSTQGPVQLGLTGIVARDSRSMRGYLVKSHLHLPEEVIGLVNKAGAELSGIPEGVEVICGCDDLTAGVIGLGVQKGVVFNLANTSEHVGMVGEEPIDGLSWLPPLGSLPARQCNPTGFGTSNTDRDVEIADLVIFPKRLWIGGGLAMNKALVKQRMPSSRQTSQYAGVAKLAQRTYMQ